MKKEDLEKLLIEAVEIVRHTANDRLAELKVRLAAQVFMKKYSFIEEKISTDY